LPALTPVSALNWFTTEWDIPGSANIPYLSVTGPVIPDINMYLLQATSSLAPIQFLSDERNRCNWRGATSCMGTLGSIGTVQPSTSVQYFNAP